MVNIEAILEFLIKIAGLREEEVLGWTRNRFKTPRSGSCASRNHHTLTQLPLDLEISWFCGFCSSFAKNPTKIRPPGPKFGCPSITSTIFFRNVKKSSHMTCIFLLVWRVLDTNLKSWENRMCMVFFIRPQSLSQIYVVGHIANQDLATRGASIPRMRAHRERQRRNAPSARQAYQIWTVIEHLSPRTPRGILVFLKKK